MEYSWHFACAQLAEAISLREALSWFKGLNMQKVQVEVDALLIVQVISSSALTTLFLALSLMIVRCF